MGFRSMIYVKFKEGEDISFKNALYAVPEKECMEKQEDQDDGYARYIGSDLKWYSGYPLVEAVEKFILNGPNRGLIAIHEDSSTQETGETSEVDMYITSDIEF